MKVLIKRKGKARSRYYSGPSVNAILKKFIQSKPNLTFVRYEYYCTRYDLVMFDLKTGRKVTFEIHW